MPDEKKKEPETEADVMDRLTAEWLEAGGGNAGAPMPDKVSDDSAFHPDEDDEEA